MGVESSTGHFRLAAICFAAFLLTSGYYAVEDQRSGEVAALGKFRDHPWLHHQQNAAIQSSLNKALGTYTISVLSLVTACASLFLPALVMEFVKKNRILGISVIPFILLTLANLHPRAYTLIPAALVLGCTYIVFYTTIFVCISDLANSHANFTNRDKDKVSSTFIGYFLGSVSVGMLAGNSVSSFVMRYFSKPELRMASNVSLISTSKTSILLTNTSISFCGIHNCDCARNESCYSGNQYRQESYGTVNKFALYTLIGGFIVVQFIAAVILWCSVVDDAEKSFQTKDTTRERLLQPDCVGSANNQNHRPSEPVIERIKKKVIATAKLYIVQPMAILFALFSIHNGLLQGFVMSQVTRDWITCNFGIEYVGYGIGIYAIGCIIGGFGLGKLSNYAPRWTIVLCDFVSEMVAIAMLWSYGEDRAMWILYLTTGILGVTHESLKSMNLTIHTIFFPNDREAALAVGGIWYGTGKGIAFIISTHICNANFLILLITLASCGTVAYLISDVVYMKTLSTM